VSEACHLKYGKELMRLIVNNCGLPPLKWIEECPKEMHEHLFTKLADGKYIMKGDTAASGSATAASASQSVPQWESDIRAWASKEGVTIVVLEAILEFLRLVFVYENRIIFE
jgi:hypothetical protein